MMDEIDDGQMVEAVKLAAQDARNPEQRRRLSAAAAFFAALGRTGLGRDRAMFAAGARAVAPAMSDAEVAQLWERVRPHA